MGWNPEYPPGPYFPVTAPGNEPGPVPQNPGGTTTANPPTYDPGYDPGSQTGGGADVGGPAPPSSPTQPPGGSGATPSIYDNGLAFFGAMTNPFFRVVRRVQKTRLTRFLESEARVGLEAMKGWWAGQQTFASMVRTSTEGRIFPNIARALTRELPVGLIIESLIPTISSDTDQFPLPMSALSNLAFSRQVRGMVGDQKRRELRQPSPAVRALELPVFTTLGERPPNFVERAERIIEGGIGRILNPAGWVPNSAFRVAPNATVITGSTPGFNDEKPGPTLQEMAETAAVGPQVAARTPASSSTSSSPAASAVHVRLGPLFIGLGAIVAANVIASRAGRGGAPAPIVPGPAVLNPPAATITPTPATDVSPYSGSGFGSGYGNAYCASTPRGPRRKCLERAPVSWRSGTRKGKAAGTKCLRYAQRRS